MSQNKGWALGPARLSFVQLEMLDWPPPKNRGSQLVMDRGLVDAGKIQLYPNLIRLNKYEW